MNKMAWVWVLALGLVACDGDEADNGEAVPDCLIEVGCITRDVPFTDGAADAPTLTNVTMECQSTSVVLLATVTDPQGSVNLQNLQQRMEVFTAIDCQGPTITLQDNLAGSGVEESFGDVVLASSDPALYNEICACNFWPVEVLLVDVDGNTTSGRARAQVTR